MTATAEKLDLDHLRQWIGRSTEASDIVTAQLVKGLRATLFQDIGEPKAGDAAPAAIFVGEERHYGAVPGIGDHVELPKAPRARSLKS